MASTTPSIEREPIPRFGGPWVMSPFFERLLEREALDPEREALVRSFAEKGYLVLEDLGIDDFDELADRVEADVAPLHDDGRFNRIADAYAVSDAVRALAANPRVLSILESLYGRRPIPFQTLNFWRGSEQATHSDAVHLHSFPRPFMCGVWVALEVTDDRNGSLHYYPGSLRITYYELVDLGLPSGKQFYDGYESFVR